MLSYPNYSCPCSEISLAGAQFASLDGTYSLIQNPENRFTIAGSPAGIPAQLWQLLHVLNV